MEKLLLSGELDNLNQMVFEMGGMVEEAINNSLSSLTLGNPELSKETIGNDQKIDNMELKINEKCLTLLALYQPVASDLRFITTAMSIVTDLERIGDLALEIAKGVIEIGENSSLLPSNWLPEIVETVKTMLRESLNSYIRRDPDLAKKVTMMKKKEDSTRMKIYQDVRNLLTEETKNINYVLPFVLIIHHLERIAGHTANIAEDVVYMVNAEVIKHLETAK